MPDRGRGGCWNCLILSDILYVWPLKCCYKNHNLQYIFKNTYRVNIFIPKQVISNKEFHLLLKGLVFFSLFKGFHKNNKFSVWVSKVPLECLSLQQECSDGHHVVVAFYTLVVPFLPRCNNPSIVDGSLYVWLYH